VPVELDSTVNVRQNPIPIQGQAGVGWYGADAPPAPAPEGMSSTGKLITALALAGLGVGAVVALTRPKRTANRRRR